MSFQDLESDRGVGSRRGYVNGKQDPTQTVASGIFQINTSVSAFQRLVNTLGTSKDTPELREKLHKTRLHIGRLVKNTSAKVKQASETDHTIEASKKITDVKLAKDFQAVLKEFQKAQRLAAERETAYTPFVLQSAFPSTYSASDVDMRTDKNPEQRVLLMESRRSLQMELQTSSMILFVVIFILSIGSSSCGEVVYKGKYITQNYFDKYNKLTKREFDNFIVNEIPSSLSEIVTDINNAGPILSGLRRDVIDEGSHRRLSSSIGFKLQHELKYELTAHSCEVIIIERLPNGVFADPFELEHLVERDEFTDAAVFGDTNLELPSFRSNQSIAEIHLSFASKVFSRNEDDSEVNLDLPLHTRYPPLGHGFSRVEFGQPDIFICCGLDVNVRNRSCLLMPTDHILDNKASAIIWDVPCGNKEHARVVSAVTFGFAIVSAMLIVLTSVCYSGSQGSNNFKLS